jgi:DNA-binding winged helix-turn-helix (wHTH) protein/tetratricopeptide (TPR) repeat protein
LIYFFGPFELDDENFSLTRHGQRLPLEPKALRVLLLMVQSQGRLLTKAALLDAVWTNTVVEESTLSRAVALLRKQLGDDPKRPVFVETVPTLGYRFIAPVGVGEPATPQAPAAAPAEAASGRKRALTLAAASAGVVVLAVVATILVLRTAPHNLTGKSTIVLAEFANSTGDGVFDDTLRQGLLVQLEQSPALTLVPEQRIGSALRMMSRPPDERLTPALGREVCERLGATAVLDGSIASLGTQFVLTLRAVNCNTGELLDTEQVQAAKKEEVLRSLSSMAATFRSRVGESLQSISSHDLALDEATTPSLDALKAFSEANRVLSIKGSAASLPMFQRAIQLDPEFALAHAMLGRAYGDVGQEVHSAESTAQAYKFREHAGERERFFITASYELQVTGNLQKALETCDTWRQIYPHDSGPYGFPAGVILRVLGRYEEGAQRGRQMVDNAPDFSMPYHLLFTNLVAADRLGEAGQLLEEASRRNLQIPFFWLDRYRLAFLRGDSPGMKQLAAQAVGQLGVEDLIAAQEAEVLAYDGHLAEARQRSQSAVDTARQAGRLEAAGRLQASSALREALFGNSEVAAADAKSALELSRGRDVLYGAAAALAMARDSERATTLANELEQRLPEDTSVRVHYLPVIRALIALNHNDPVSALERLQPNQPFELGTPQSAFGGYYGTLYPVYVRGLALLALNRGSEAAAEFKKILNPPGLVVADPIGVLARVQLTQADGARRP